MTARETIKRIRDTARTAQTVRAADALPVCEWLEDTERDLDEALATVKRQGELLTGVVNAIKGAPRSPTLSHSHADAPTLARGMIAELTRLREWVRDLQAGRVETCIYCGHRIGPAGDAPGQPELVSIAAAHALGCPAHPMAALRRENEVLRGLVQTNPDWRCPHGQDVKTLGLCPLGFPGCGCADDRLALLVVGYDVALERIRRERDAARAALRAARGPANEPDPEARPR